MVLLVMTSLSSSPPLSLQLLEAQQRQDTCVKTILSMEEAHSYKHLCRGELPMVTTTSSSTMASISTTFFGTICAPCLLAHAMLCFHHRPSVHIPHSSLLDNNCMQFLKVEVREPSLELPSIF